MTGVGKKCLGNTGQDTFSIRDEVLYFSQDRFKMPYYRNRRTRRSRYFKRNNNRGNVGLPYFNKRQCKTYVNSDVQFQTTDIASGTFPQYNVYNSSQINSRDITAIPRSNINLNNRDYEGMALSGIRLRIMMQNPDSVPHYVRLWVVSYKGNDQTNIPLDQVGDPIVTANFYRGYTSRAVDYASTTRSFMQHVGHAINTDCYNILWAKHFWLGHNGDNTRAFGDTVRPDWKWIDKYIPCHRVITYDTDAPTTIPTSGRIFLIWDHHSPLKSEGGEINQGAQMRMGYYASISFKDIKQV